MTKQEVIELIDNKDTLVNSDDQDAKIIIIEALEKQIPKEPINKTKADNGVAQHYENCHIVVCPSCVGRLKLKSRGNYCDKCGQAIKWE